MVDNENLEVLHEQGYTCWEQYVKCMADDYGVDYEIADALFDMLGPSEAFDGFVTALEDASYY